MKTIAPQPADWFACVKQMNRTDGTAGSYYAIFFIGEEVAWLRIPVLVDHCDQPSTPLPSPQKPKEAKDG
jgi:hypothetical protein